MSDVNALSEQTMRDFIRRELPKINEEILDDAIIQIGFARAQYSRYANARKCTNSRFTYKSKKASCRRMMTKIAELKSELQQADLMLLDEMHEYVGYSHFQGEVTAQLDRLSTTCEVLLKTIPTFVERGRPVDRILYDWVLNMIRIYEDLFKPRVRRRPGAKRPKEIDHRKNGKFMKYLKCWKPDELPIYGDKLSPRTIHRILKFRQYYRDDLRNTFKPDNTYSSKIWANRKPTREKKK